MYCLDKLFMRCAECDLVVYYPEFQGSSPPQPVYISLLISFEGTPFKNCIILTSMHTLTTWQYEMLITSWMQRRNEILAELHKFLIKFDLLCAKYLSMCNCDQKLKSWQFVTEISFHEFPAVTILDQVPILSSTEVVEIPSLSSNQAIVWRFGPKHSIIIPYSTGTGLFREKIRP